MKELAERLAQGIKEAARGAKSEEDLRVAVSILLAPILRELGISAPPEFEKTVITGSADAVYGRACIEYKKPGRLGTASAVKDAALQLKKYLLGAASKYRKQREDELRRMVGIGLDGFHIMFLRYTGAKRRVEFPQLVRAVAQLPLFEEESVKGAFQVQGPYPVTEESVALFLTYLRALRRRPLTPDLVADEFGPKGDVAAAAIRAFYEAAVNCASAKVGTLFRQWDRIFGAVYGQETERSQADAADFAKVYRMDEIPALKQFLFAVHSYFALFMKLLVAELVSLQRGSFVSSFIADLPALSDGELKRRLASLEDGGVFDSYGIKNFLEGDFFGWYLSAWCEDISTAVRNLILKLSDFEPAATTLEPEETRDLLKRLYQYLVPKKLRHDLGEYYTPDWLAERVLRQVGYDGNPDKRLLDPACGSGTFLVLAIKEAKEYASDKLLDRLEAKAVAEKILKNIVGFDLNPLAVIAARTLYLLALGELIRYVRPVEIPVYICDSIATPARYHELFKKGHGLPTVEGDFFLPPEVISQGNIEKLSSLLEDCAKNEYAKGDFLTRARRELPLAGEESERMLGDLYAKLLALKKEGKNDIWARLIKNSFAPLFVPRFDYVVGNPPWVNWESLADDYRAITKPLWEEYGLFSLKGQEARLGGGKKDFSMLFTYACLDNYLKKRGKLGFVITQTVFKTKGAGDGFRRFKLGKREPFKVIQVDDMVDLQPFEGATNRTSVLILQKGEPTTPPVPYMLWTKKVPGGINVSANLDDVLNRTKRAQLTARPVDPHKPTSPWITGRHKAMGALEKVTNKSAYKAWEGANTGGLNGAYWVSLSAERPDGILVIENLWDVGKIKVNKVQSEIEPDLIFPLLRGRDVQRWQAQPSAHILMVQDPQKRVGYDEDWLKTRLPKTYLYLKQFESLLRERSGYKKYFDPRDHPFYSMYNVGPYTSAPFKVVWREQASALTVAVVTAEKDKPVVPDHKLMLVPFNDAAEAHYVCGALASSMAQFVVKSYILETSTSTHILEHIAIPKFDPKNTVHAELSRLSVKAHELATKGDEKSKKELLEVEAEIDLAAAEFWEITAEELMEIKRSLKELL